MGPPGPLCARVEGATSPLPLYFLPLFLPLCWPRRRPLAGEAAGPLPSLSSPSLSPSLLPLSLSFGVAGGHPWPAPATEGRRGPRRPPLAALPRPGALPGQGLLALAMLGEGAVAPSLFLLWGGRGHPSAGETPALRRRPVAGGRSRPGAEAPGPVQGAAAPCPVLSLSCPVLSLSSSLFSLSSLYNSSPSLSSVSLSNSSLDPL